jgi:hypothetical protein
MAGGREEIFVPVALLHSLWAARRPSPLILNPKAQDTNGDDDDDEILLLHLFVWRYRRYLVFSSSPLHFCRRIQSIFVQCRKLEFAQLAQRSRR